MIRPKTYIRLRVIALSVILSAVALSCASDDNGEPVYDSAEPYTLPDISYGNDPKQTMDIYLPAHRNADRTKVFVLIHGGGWVAGDKSGYAYLFDALKSMYPDYAIVNMNYRLATLSSPGYPKQIHDIQQALDHARLPTYDLSNQYFLFGTSAGGHLALLYAYAFDEHHYVKGVCNTVGPADMTDPALWDNPDLAPILYGLVGNVTYDENPGLYEEVSPAKQVMPDAPKTISFYGDSDPLVPASQMNLLHDELTAHGVYNEATMYEGEGHGGWGQANNEDYVMKIVNFIAQHF